MHPINNIAEDNDRPAVEEPGGHEFVKAKVQAGIASAEGGRSIPAREAGERAKAKVRAAAAREG